MGVGVQAGPQRSHESWIDGMRALAVLGIVLFAVFEPAQSLFSGGWIALYPIVGAGIHGLDLLFVLSGFVLALPYVRRDGAGDFSVSRFATARLVRLAPAYWVTLAVLLAASFLRPGLVPSVPFIDVVRQALFLNWNTALLAPSLWPLGALAFAYVTFPFALVLWLRSPRAFTTLVIALLAAFTVTRAHSQDLGMLPAFLMGIVAAAWRGSGNRYERFAFGYAGLAALVALAFDTFVSGDGASALDPLSPFPQLSIFWQVAAMFAVLAVSSSPLVRRIAGFGPLALGGCASYGIFLAYAPAIAFVRATYGAQASVERAATEVAVAIGAGFVLWLAVDLWFSRDRRATAIVARLEPRIGAVLAFAGLPLQLRLERSSPAVPAPQLVPVVPPPLNPNLAQGSGTFEELQAEIARMKAQLSNSAQGAFSAAPSEPAPTILSAAPLEASEEQYDLERRLDELRRTEEDLERARVELEQHLSELARAERETIHAANEGFIETYSERSGERAG